MNQRRTWLAAILSFALMTTSLSGVSAQADPVKADMIEPVPSVRLMNSFPSMELPVMDGQDYVEPGVTPEMSRDRALELAVQALKTHANMDVTQGNFQLNTEYRRDWQQPERYVWSLYWYLNEPMAYANAGVTLDAKTGQILDLNQDRGSYAEPKRSQLNFTREEAQAIGISFVEKIIPGKLDHMILRDSQEVYPIMSYGGPYQYTFNYVRQISGIVYDANFVNVSVDGSTGEIKWFSQRWEDRPQLPDSAGIISESEAKSLFEDLMQLELFYLPLRNEFMYEPMPKNFRLAYRMSQMTTNMINAKTGKPLDWSGREETLSFLEKDLTAAQKAAIARQAEPITSLPQPMEQQQAEELAYRYAGELLDSGIEIQSTNYVEGDQFWESAGRKAWNMDFMIVNPEGDQSGQEVSRMPYSSGRIMVNALTGELIAFNWWQYYEGPFTGSDEPVISWEEGYDKAIEALSAYHPGRINHIRTLQRSTQVREVMDGQIMQPMEYYYTFPRMVNGILLDENHVSIGVNARTGKITNYTDRWSEELTLPRPDRAMNEELALNRLLENYRLELAYFRYNPTEDYINPKYETKLVYRWMPKESMAGYPYIDAIDGTPLDYNGRAVPGRDPEGFEARIQGHWVERTARLMAQQGILDTTQFVPNEPITKMEAVKMMVKARGTDFYGPVMEMGGDKVEFVDVPESDEDYRYIQWAIRYGYIDNLPEEFQREALITRADTALMLSRFMGYRQLAEAGEIFRVSYSDAGAIPSEAFGAVAISQGLGVISSNGTFRPNDHATMAELAEMLFKAMAHQRR